MVFNINVHSFTFKIHKFYSDEAADEELKAEYRLNDFEVINGLFVILEESDENLTHLVLETIFILAKVPIFCTFFLFITTGI